MARARGYSSKSDVLVSKTSDGIDLNVIWDQIKQAQTVYNQHQSAIISLLTFKTTAPGDAVEQGASLPAFEAATEYGVPKSIRQGTALPVGYTLTDVDLRQGLTYQYLRSATAAQVKDLANTALAADQRNLTTMVLQRLLDPTVGTNPEGVPVYGLYNGSGSMIPPSYMGTDFAASHNHVLVSGGAAIDSEDVEVAYGHLIEHGLGLAIGSRVIFLCNHVEAEVISSFRAGVVNNNSKTAKHSFIASAGAPPYLTDQTLVGERAPDKLGNLPILGSYGRAWIAETPLMPAGYIAAVVTNGADSPLNVIGFREWPAPEYQGLRLIDGPGPYPIQDSFWTRAAGVGVRQRGGAVVMQIKASGSYDIPTVLV